MSEKSWSNLLCKLLYKMGQDIFDRQYEAECSDICLSDPDPHWFNAKDLIP